MCSPNVHFEHLIGSSNPPSASQQAAHPFRSLSHARIAGASSWRPASTNGSDPASSTAALLSHTINHRSSVLSLAVDERRNLLYSGSQEGTVHVWDLETFHPTAHLQGHTGSVLALELAPEKHWLFSSSGDNTVRVWHTDTNLPLFVVHPAEDNVGDIFALKWCPVLETLYLGCQSTSIQWICLAGFDKQPSSSKRFHVNPPLAPHNDNGSTSFGDSLAGADSPIISTPDIVARPHKFFDSVPVALSRSGMGSGGASTPTRVRPPSSSQQGLVKTALVNDRPHATESEAHLSERGPLASTRTTEKVLQAATQRLDSAAVEGAPTSHDVVRDDSAGLERTLLVPPTSSVPSAHFGYVYCLALLTLEGDSQHPTVLASGSGDETIKLWHATRAGLSLLATLESPNADGNAVLALASWKTTLFAGLQGGEVEVWDLETCTLVRTIRAHTDDVICLETCPESGLLFTAGADGNVHTWDRSFRCINRLQAHKGIVLSMTKVRVPVRSHVHDSSVHWQGPAAAAAVAAARVSQLITGSSDNLIRIWDTTLSPAPPASSSEPVAELRRRELEHLSLDDAAAASLSSTPIANATHGNPAGEVAAAAEAEAEVEAVSAQWPLLRSLLRRFVAIPSVSSSEEHREDCRQAAHFLKSCFQELGAEARILPNPVGTNPLVLATFKANANRTRRRRTAAGGAQDRSRSTSTSASTASTDSSDSHIDVDRDEDDEAAGLSGSIMFDRLEADEGADAGEEARARPRPKKRCLFYGHYDCIAAEGSWTSDPFTLDGRDGYLYGRGVSDNKGPILAAACAVHRLLSTRRLHSDVVFLIEGEEENGSVGFVEAVRRYKSEIGAIDVVLLSNSYWLDDETPCLTVGLRGVVRARVTVGGGERDVHSGVEGGAIREPMVDMVKLLAALTGDGERVALPGFYDDVRPTTESEVEAYRDVVRIKQSRHGAAETVGSLMAKWRYPSLSVHNLRVSGPGNSTVIPSSVEAQVSLRIVPDQQLAAIEASLRSHVAQTFETLYTAPASSGRVVRNKVSVTVDHRADWWLGSDSSSYFGLLRDAVRHEWNAQPISIREGGSIPAIAILEQELGAAAVHLPMGQSSDCAHLPNERLRQTNLVKGHNVVLRFVDGLAHV